MIYRIIESKLAFAITAIAFVSALVWNMNQGAGLSLPGHGVFAPAVVAHGPTLPPDPWAGGNTGNLLMAHGPTLPPDPWAGGNTGNLLMAHGPTLPPDPWAGGNTGNLLMAH